MTVVAAAIFTIAPNPATTLYNFRGEQLRNLPVVLETLSTFLVVDNIYFFEALILFQYWN